MSFSYTPSPEESGHDLVVGSHIKCPKGEWQKDDEPLKTGKDGARMAVLMHLAESADVTWDNSGKVPVPIISNRVPYAEGNPHPGKRPEGVGAYTVFPCLINEGPVADYTKGKLGTFTASSWSARKSFRQDLLGDWRIMHSHEVPVCTLSTRPAGDDNDNIAPKWDVIEWIPLSKFGDILGGGAPQIDRPIDPGVKRLQEVPAKIAAMVAEANAPIIKGKAEISSGRNRDAGDDSRVQAPPPDRYNGPDGPDDLNDSVPF